MLIPPYANHILMLSCFFKTHNNSSYNNLKTVQVLYKIPFFECVILLKQLISYLEADQSAMSM